MTFFNDLCHFLEVSETLLEIIGKIEHFAISDSLNQLGPTYSQKMTTWQRKLSRASGKHT